MKNWFPIVLMVLILSCKKDKEPGVSGTYISSTDSNFVLKASMNNYTSIQLCHIANTISNDSAITAYAGLIINEHTDYRQSLMDLADSLNIPVADSLDPSHLVLRSYLLTLSGRQFDSVFIHNQFADNVTLYQLHQNEISSGNNSRIKSFALNHRSEIEQQRNLSDSIAAGF